jgi:hypothetical protein
MRILTEHPHNLISPVLLAISLSISSFVVAEETPVNSVANTPVTTSITNNIVTKSLATESLATESVALNTNQKLVTPRLQDGQNAFNSGNYDLAFSLWQTRATQGHTDAQVFVGLSYANGWGVDKNTKLASHWYQKAAANNNATGQFLLGLYLISGKDADLPKGVMWLNRAANNGDNSAKKFLKKAKRRGWFDTAPKIKQKKGNKAETVAMAGIEKL